MEQQAAASKAYLEGLAQALIGLTALMFFFVPLAFEFFWPDKSLPGWFWGGLVLGVVGSVMLNQAALRVAQIERRQQA